MHPAAMPTPQSVEPLPDHTQLPDRDDSVVTNTQEHPQSNLLTECLRPRLRELHPRGDFCIGCDVGIYFEYTDPVLDGCRAPDWFYVPGVPPMLDGKARRSYVLWKELVKPALVVEYVSGDGSEEHDATPHKGTFWIYERVISAGHYVILDAPNATLEVFCLVAGAYAQVLPNEAGRFPLRNLGIEMGLWEGTYRDLTMPWLRIWDAATGLMLPLGEERAEVAESALEETRLILAEQVEYTEAQRQRAEAERQRAEAERQRAEAERQRAEAERQRADALAAKLRALGIDPGA